MVERNVADAPSLTTNVVPWEEHIMKIAWGLLFTFTVLSHCHGDAATRTLYTRGQFEFYIINRTLIRSARCREFTQINKSVTAPFLKEFDVDAVARASDHHN